MSQNIINVKNLVKQVSTINQPHNTQIDILTGVNLQIKHGESVAIVGASGSGKSTLLGLLAGLDQATSGEIFIDEQNISTLSEDQRAQIRSHMVGFVFQSFQLLPSLSALENVMFPLELQGKLNAQEAALKLLKRVGLEKRYSHYRSNSLVVSSNVWRLPAHLSPSLKYCLLMNLRVILIKPRVKILLICYLKSIRKKYHAGYRHPR